MVRAAPFLGVRLFDLLLLAGFAILFVLLIVWLIRRTDEGGRGRLPGPPPYQQAGPAAGAGSPPMPPADPAMDILRARFARGEITEEEFLSASRALAQAPR